MKNGKFLKSLIALSCCMAMGLGVVAGCNREPECEHVYTWTTHSGDEATCTKAGKQTGVCGLCGDVKYEELPIDGNAHTFTGEWDITKKPTEEADGLAVKTCANNPEHKVEIVLPMVTITAAGYDESVFITVPTTARKGEMELTLKNQYGDVTFKVELEKRKLDNMEDAVVLASSLRENVRSVEGTSKESLEAGEQKFSYYFGDDYTYIKDEINNKESWYSLDDDGKVFAMSKEIGSSTATVEAKPDEGCLEGIRYESTINISSFYGAENGLAQIYNVGKNGIATGSTVNYKEISKDEINDDEHKGKDGSRNNLWFSYGYDEGSWFARFKVVFSIYPDGTLKKLFIETEVIRGYMFTTEPDGTKIYYEEGDKSVTDHGAAVGDVVFGYVYPTDFKNSGNLYEYDEKGKICYEQTNKLTGNVVYKSGDIYYDVIGGEEKANTDGTISYITKYQQLDYVPELEDVYVKDVYGEFVYDSNGNKIKKYMAAGGYPVTEHYSDTHSEVSFKTVTFEQTKKVTQEEVDSGLRDPEVVPPNPYPSDSLYINDFDITGATSNGVAIDISNGLILPTNKPIVFSLGNVIPESATLNSDAIANIYAKDATGALIKLNDLSYNNGSQYKILGFFTIADGTVTINSQYAGDVTLVFETKSGKCKKEFNMTFTRSAPTKISVSADEYYEKDGVADYRESVVSVERPVELIVGQPLKFRAVADKAEAAYVSTDIMPSSSAGIVFSQSERDSYKEWELVAEQEGEYIVKVSYFNGTGSDENIYAEFKVIVSPAQEPMDMLSGSTFSGKVLMSEGVGNPLPKTLTAVFTDKGEINISVAGNSLVYTYFINDDGELVTAYKSGITAADNKSYDFSFSINEAGRLVVTHSKGLGNKTEDIVLSKVVEADSQA